MNLNNGDYKATMESINFGGFSFFEVSEKLTSWLKEYESTFNVYDITIVEHPTDHTHSTYWACVYYDQ
jgi:hypothetical protein